MAAKMDAQYSSTSRVPADHLEEVTFAPRFPKVIDSVLLSLPVDRLIAFSRLALGGSAFIAIAVDATQPTQSAGLVFSILSAYCIYAVLLVAWVLHRDLSNRFALLVNIVDIATLAALTHYSEAITSPFLVLFTFVLLSATLRWNWQGAIYNAAALAGLMIFSVAAQLYEQHRDLIELNRVMILLVVLVTTGVMLAYFGAVRELSRDRLRRLANWPREDLCGSNSPSLARTLGHASAISRAREAIAAWEAEEEPFTYVVSWQGDKCEERKVPLGSIKRFVAPELERAVFVADQSGVISPSIPGLPRHPLDTIVDQQIADLRRLRRNRHRSVLERDWPRPGFLN